MGIEFCWSCGKSEQPCICVTEFGEKPMLVQRNSQSYAGKYLEANGTYLPICGTNGDEDPEAYPTLGEK